MSAIDATAATNPLQDYLTQQAQSLAATKAATTSAAGTSSIASQSIAGKFDTFLKILTTQLTHQDPTAATDTNQFTQELVQFSQAEQQLNTNTNLLTLINLVKNNSGLTQTLNYIDKYVEVPANNQIPLQNHQAEIAYTLPSGANNVTINVTDADGRTVAILNAPVKAGLNRVAWDGKDLGGEQLEDGTYKFQLMAKDIGGKTMTVNDIRTVGLVTAVQSNADGTTSLTLSSGLTADASKVGAVYSPSNLPIAVLGNAPLGNTPTT
jgi:flagellar basal-body rod modification protein FlgD